MSEPAPDLEQLFLAAMELQSLEEQSEFLDRSCGDNSELRDHLKAMLGAQGNIESFLENPPVDVEMTVIPGTPKGDPNVEKDELVAPTMGAEVAVGDSSDLSVLSSLGKMIDVPRVLLRDPQAESSDPIMQLNSPEVAGVEADSRYQLLGEIARGGMGAILKGRDTDLGRDLAVKVLLESHRDKPEVIQRFVEEAQIGGQLQHPGIAPVYELGQLADRRPFFSMKLVKGDTLSKLLADRESPSEDRGRLIGIFEQICQTMAYAHSRGVIHRDLKPANIMVGAFGEVQVMDWGLAKVLSTGGVADEKKSHQQNLGRSIIQTIRSGAGSDAIPVGTVGSNTQMGSVMGTPAYMPPEQALGEIDNLDERADVFGLGAILAEILTGRPPYVADNGTQVYRMASRGKLDDCHKRLDQSAADQELIQLTKDCLKLEPVDRPRNSGELAARVNEYLRSVESKFHDAEMERVANEARLVEERKRRKISLALAASILLTLGVVSSGWMYMERQKANQLVQESETHRQHAIQMEALADKQEELANQREVQRNLAVAATQEAQRQAYSSAIAAALADLERNDSRVVRRRLEDAPEKFRGWEWDYLWNAADQSLGTILTQPPQQLGYMMQFSDDGSLIASRAHGAHSQPILIHDTQTGKEITSLKTVSSNYPAMRFSSNNRYLALQFWGTPGVQIYDITTGATKIAKPRTFAYFLAFTQDSESAIVVNDQRTPEIRKISDWELISSLPVQADARGIELGMINSALNPDENLLVIGARSEDPIRVFDLDSMKVAHEIQVKSATASVAFDADGAHFTILAKDGSISKYATSDWKEVSTVSKTESRAALGFYQDSDNQLMVTSDERGLVILNSKGQQLNRLRGHYSDMVAVHVDAEHHEILSAHKDGAVRRWDLDYRPGLAASHSVALTDDGQTAWTGVPMGSRTTTQIISLDVTSHTEQLRLRAFPHTISHGGAATGITFSPDETLVAFSEHTSWGRGAWKVMDTVTGLTQKTYRFWGSDGTCIDWSPDGRWIVAGAINYSEKKSGNEKTGKLFVFDAQSLDSEPQKLSFANPVNDVLVSADSTYAVMACEDGTARAFFIPYGEVLNNFGSNQDAARRCLAISPKDGTVAIGSADGSIDVWNPLTNESIVRLQVRESALNTVAFTPDGSRLLVAGEDQTLTCISAVDWKQLMTLYLRDVITDMHFPPDGRRLIAATNQGLAVFDTIAVADRRRERRQFHEALKAAESEAKQVRASYEDIRTAFESVLSDNSLVPQQKRATTFQLRNELSAELKQEYDFEVQLPALSSRMMLNGLEYFAGANYDDSVSAFQNKCLGRLTLSPLKQQAAEDFLASFLRASRVNTPYDKTVQETTINAARRTLFASTKREDLMPAYLFLSNSPESLYHGIAAYRVGAYQEALDLLRSVPGLFPTPDNLAFTAMAQHHLGDTEGATATMLRLETTLKLDAFKDLPPDSFLARFTNEARETLETKPAPDEPFDEIAYWATLQQELWDMGADGTTLARWRSSSLARIAERHKDDPTSDWREQLEEADRTFLQSLLEFEPANEWQAGNLASLLLNFDGEPWQVLKPASLESNRGSKLMGLPDFSVLAEKATDKGASKFTIAGRPNLTSVAAVRLEVLPLIRLPNAGPGRASNGNFRLREMRIFVRKGELEQRTPIKLSKPSATYQYNDFQAAKAIDGNPNTRWEVWKRPGQSHTAIFQFETPIELEEGQEFLIELDHHQDHEIGRFRISFAPLNRRLEVTVSQTRDKWIKLAGAFIIRDETDALAQLLEARPELQTATADLFAADEQWELAIEGYTKLITPKTDDANLFAKRARSYMGAKKWNLAIEDWRRAVELDGRAAQAFYALRSKERWRDAIEFGLVFINQEPDNSMRWLQVAPVVVLTGDKEAYQSFRERVAQQFGNAQSPGKAEQSTKAALLTPDAFAFERMPIVRLTAALDEGQAPARMQPWWWSTRAFYSYRTGNFERAIECCDKVESLNPNSHTRMLSTVLKAMAQWQLKQPSKAHETLQKIAALMDQLSSDQIANHHDLQIPAILYREAKELIGSSTGKAAE